MNKALYKDICKNKIRTLIVESTELNPQIKLKQRCITILCTYRRRYQKKQKKG